jgi:hypothetical protein
LKRSPPISARARASSKRDWHVVRAIGVIAQVDTAGMAPAFSGGTSLSKGWELIKRFSEDIDFKVGEPAAKEQ